LTEEDQTSLSFPSNFMGLVDMEGGLQLSDGEIRVRIAQSEVEVLLPP
jgi:hypothetical protein